MRKNVICFIVYFCFSLFTFFVNAQDIIVKNDKTEIKAKVTELTETGIKYKKWENIDGPVYTISKAEVFMILYANGQRELITALPVAVSTPVPIASYQAPEATSSNISEYESNGESLIRLATNTGFNLVDLEWEWRYKFGLKKDLSIGMGSNITYASNAGVYIYGIASQRFWLKPADQQNPVRVWVSAGVANTYDWTDFKALGTGSFLWEAGTDVGLGKWGDFGLTVYTPKFQGVFFGVYLIF
jgi:hypothetical protein